MNSLTYIIMTRYSFVDLNSLLFYLIIYSCAFYFYHFIQPTRFINIFLRIAYIVFNHVDSLKLETTHPLAAHTCQTICHFFWIYYYTIWSNVVIFSLNLWFKKCVFRANNECSHEWESQCHFICLHARCLLSSLLVCVSYFECQVVLSSLKLTLNPTNWNLKKKSNAKILLSKYRHPMQSMKKKKENRSSDT